MEQPSEGRGRDEVLDSMLDWELLVDSRADGEDLFLDELEVNIRKPDVKYTAEEEQKLVAYLLELAIEPDHSEKATRCLCLFIRLKLQEPIIVCAVADQFYDYFVGEHSVLALKAIKTLITELPSINLMDWDTTSRSTQLALRLVEALAPRIAGGITKINVSDSLAIMSMLLRHFGPIMRSHAKLCNMQFLGDYFCTGVQLGKGSYANVFLGRHVRTADVVAIKVMNWEQLTKGREKLSKALENEIKIMNESDHPNIVRLFHSMREGCNLNLILEYCGGGSLEEYMLKKGPLSEEETLHWLHELALGLKFLHDRSILHRDLKPGNLLLTADSPTASLKITDFTFARFIEPGDLATTLVGTPLYMAPEIFKDGQYTEKSDLWSVGVLIYQMLTGRLPYRGGNLIELIQDINNSDLKWPDSIKLSPDTKDLLLSLLQKNPDLRISWTEFFMHPSVRIIDTLGDSTDIPDSDDMELTQCITNKLQVQAENPTDTLKAVRAELAHRTNELKETKEELIMTKERLAKTEEDLDDTLKKVVLGEEAKQRAELETERVAAEKAALEARVSELKHQVLQIASSKIKESALEEVEQLRSQNTMLVNLVEALTSELEVYKVAMHSDAAEMGIKGTLMGFLPTFRNNANAEKK